MDYNPTCMTTGVCQHPVYATQSHSQIHPWTCVPQYQYGYLPNTAAPPVDHALTQAPGMPPINVTACEAVDERHGYLQLHPEQPIVYTNGGEVDYGQRLSPTVEVNVEELLEYQRRRSSASTDDKEPLTPAQRRRKAQNRAAQRAFRDRKRQRVQDLEAQLSALEVRTNSLESDNERLKQELLLTQNENVVLRSMAESSAHHGTVYLDHHGRADEEDGLAQHLPLQ